MKNIVLIAIVMLTFSAGAALAADQAPTMASVKYTGAPTAALPHDMAVEAKSGMEFVRVKGGCFCMGAASSGEGMADALPVHEVCIDDYSMAKFEVTGAQWRAVMGSIPSMPAGCGDDCPVVNVSWEDVQTFISRLNERTGKSYRLPTEAEWEYAARSGANGKMLSANSASDSGAHTLRPVGLSQPNSLGIYDMHGNVWEWTGDRYGKTYYRSSPKNNPEGPAEGQFRVLRGGSWVDTERVQQPAFRIRYEAWIERPWVGFRLIETDLASAQRRLPNDAAAASDGGQCRIIQEASIR